MLSADLLENVDVHPALNTAHRITAQKIDFVDFGQLITEFFVLNRGMDITLCPQEMRAFSEIGG